MAGDVTDELGIHDSGLDELLQALTGPAEPGELGAEHSALVMFRESVTASPGAGAGGVAGRAAASGWLATRPIRNPMRGPVRWNVRLAAAAAAAVVVCGGMAAAAYASALPGPVQRVAHEVFQFAGVPPSQAGSGHGTPAGQRPSASASPASAVPSGAAPTAGAAGPSATSGGAVLSATADAAEITAGAGVVISGQLSWPGHVVSGLTMTVLERPALSLTWQVVGSVPASAAGAGAVMVPAVGTDAVFRIAVSGVAISAPVRVTVVPAVSLAQVTGSGGKIDLVTVSAPSAQSGNVVILQVSAGGGAWTYLRAGTLSALHTVSFLLSTAQVGSEEVRGVLLLTGLHAESVSAPITVPQG